MVKWRVLVVFAFLCDMSDQTKSLDLGHLLTGVVQWHPNSGRFVIVVQDGDVESGLFDVQKALEAYEGKEVRLTLVTTEAIEKMAAIVAAQDS